MGDKTLKTIRLVLMSAIVISAAPPAHAKYHAKKHKNPETAAAEQETLTQAGLQNLDHREYAAAIANFHKAVQEKGTSGGYFLLGYAYYQRGFMNGTPEAADKQDAIEVVNAYTTAMALDPRLAEVRQPYKLYHGLGMAYEALGSDDKALDSYKRAMLMAPSNPMLPLYASRVRMKTGDQTSSLSNLEMSLKRARLLGQEAALISAIKTNPMFAPIAQSAEHMRLLREFDSSAAAMAMPAQTAAPQEAAPRATSLAAMTPKPAPAQDAYGLRDSVRQPAAAPAAPKTSREDQAVLDAIASGNDEFKFRRYAKAIDLYNDALVLNERTGALSPGQAAFVQERIGTSYNKLGQTTEAITALRRSVQAMPYNASAHYQLSLAYSVSGHFNEAMKALREAFKTAPSDGELRKFMLLAKTDGELDPVRDMPAFQTALNDFSGRAQAKAGR